MKIGCAGSIWTFTAVFLLGGCAQSVRMVRPPPPPTNQAPTPVPQPVQFEVAFDARADRNTFKAKVRPRDPSPGNSNPCASPCDVTGEFQQGTTATWPTQFILPSGNYVLRLEADMSPSQAFDSTGEDFFFNVLPPTVPPPSAVSTLMPSSGSVGTEVSVAGTGFDASHAVSFGGTGLTTTFVSSNELRFKAPQIAASSYPVSVAGVGNLSFNLTTGTLGAAPTTLNVPISNSTVLNVSLPLPAPPGGVRLTVAATPSNLLQLPSSLSVSRGTSGSSLSITGLRVGSGTIQITGTGYAPLSLAFTSALGAARCSARPAVGGGIDLLSLSTGQQVGHLPSAQTPGRVLPSPDGKRAVAQFNNGISFVDLVACNSLGSFQSTSTPLSRIVFTDDSQYMVGDWNNAAQGGGLAAYELLGGSFLFNDTTTSASVNLVTAADSTGSFAFWITSGQSGISLTTEALTPPRHSCNFQPVPSNNISVSMTGGVASIQFQGIPQPQTWRVNPSTCARLP